MSYRIRIKGDGQKSSSERLLQILTEGTESDRLYIPCEIAMIQAEVYGSIFHSAQKEMSIREFMEHIKEPEYAKPFIDSSDPDADDELVDLVEDPHYERLDFSEICFHELEDPEQEVRRQVRELVDRGYHINAYYSVCEFDMCMRYQGEESPLGEMEEMVLALARDLVQKQDKPRAVDLCHMLGMNRQETIDYLERYTR